jgi:hypothetical protein
MVAVAAGVVSYRAAAPKANTDASTFVDGERVTIEGTSICLEHAVKSDVQTMECASGLRTADGTDYALRDTTDDYSLIMKISSSKKSKIWGVYRTSADSKYSQRGTIEVTSVEILQ